MEYTCGHHALQPHVDDRCPHHFVTLQLVTLQLVTLHATPGPAPSLSQAWVWHASHTREKSTLGCLAGRHRHHMQRLDPGRCAPVQCFLLFFLGDIHFCLPARRQLSGPLIVTLSLAGRAVMTFEKDRAKTGQGVRVHLPQRSLQVRWPMLSYTWGCALAYTCPIPTRAMFIHIPVQSICSPGLLLTLVCTMPAHERLDPSAPMMQWTLLAASAAYALLAPEC